MKTLAMSAFALVSMSIVPLSAAPLKVAAETSNDPRVQCSLSSGVGHNCRNVLNFKTFYECQTNRMERGWTSIESSNYCRTLDVK
ncbi:hypothetical protein ACVIN2_000004 [Bradyrhizobium sp. USDA 3650]